MSREFERRAYAFEIRADSGDEKAAGVITGRPIIYDSVTDLGFFDEVIAKGALDNANLKDVRFLVNHDVSRIPLARSRNNNKNSTMQLSPDAEGLAIRVNLDIENNADAKSLYSAIERGDISGMSFMFAVDGEEWADVDSDHPTRTITSISDVLEVSAVTFPAYEETSIGVRDRAKAALDNARAALDSVKASDRAALDSALELAKAKNRVIGGLV